MALNLENKKQIAILLLAVGLGLVAAFLTSQYIESSLQKRAKAYKKEFEKKQIGPLVAKIGSLEKALRQMAAEQKALQKRQQQQAKLVKAAVTKSKKPQEVKKKKPVIERTVFSAITPRGKRAYTVSIDSLSAVGGLINPGDVVDVIAELELSDTNARGKKKKKTKIISVLFQQIQVLAVGTNFKPLGDPELYKKQQKEKNLTVTLAVDPEQAGLLTFAQANGKIRFSLRPPSERGIRPLEVASWDSLSDYVLEHQGTKLTIPKKKSTVQTTRIIEDSEDDEVKPFIQIFRGGQEL